MKIKYSLLDRLCNLTNKEVDFLLYIAHYQDDYGRIRGIYYRDVCRACDMCKQTFYDVLRSLQQKSIITYVRADQDYNITILDNDFPTRAHMKRGISMYPDPYLMVNGSTNCGPKRKFLCCS